MLIYKLSREEFSHLISKKSCDEKYNELKNALLEAKKNFKFCPKNKCGEIYYIVYQKKENKFIGLGIGCVYSNKKISRCSNWDFGENMHRELWIDYLVSLEKGTGTRILNELENHLKNHLECVERKNIYITSVRGAEGFYYKNGYKEIITKETDLDEDEPSVFNSEHCSHMCKFFSNEDEEIYEYDLKSSYTYVDAITKKLKHILGELFNDYNLEISEYEFKIKEIAKSKNFAILKYKLNDEDDFLDLFSNNEA